MGGIQPAPASTPAATTTPHLFWSAAFEQYFQNRFNVPSPFPTNRDVYPYAPVQMGFNGAFVYLKAVYSFGL